MTTNKSCPFQFSWKELTVKKCDGAGCQLWVNLEKDRILVTGRHSRMPDPDAKYIYEGCGLVTAIPWILVNKGKEVKKQ